MRSDFGGGNFYRKVERCELRGFFKVKKVGKKETRIRPNIPLIEKEIKRKQIENLRSSNKTLYTALKPGDTINRARALPIESVKVFDRLGMEVTHTNSKEATKQPK